MKTWDAVVVGSGPNGLMAAVTLALAGRSVLVLEANQHFGGGTQSSELTLPGFVHDVCSAVHPLAVFRPVVGKPYRTPDPQLFMCSAATPHERAADRATGGSR